MRASLKGHLDCVKLLISLNANVKLKCIYGVTALDIAKYYKKHNVVKYLSCFL